MRISPLILAPLTLALAGAAPAASGGGGGGDEFTYDFAGQPYGPLNPSTLSPEPRPGKRLNIGNGQVLDDPAQAGNKVLQINHPAGAVGPAEGSGLRFDTDIAPAEAYWLSYRVRFADDFDWKAGGKLPGLLGGVETFGGNPTDGAGWSVRQMWVQGGNLIPYVYHRDQPGTYGDAFGGTGSLGAASRFTPGQWHHLALHVRLNTGDDFDGRYMLFLDGTLLKDADGLRYRQPDTALIDTLHVSTFFGGNSDEYRPDEDEKIMFDDFRLSPDADFVFQTLPGGTPHEAVLPEPGSMALVLAGCLTAIVRRRPASSRFPR